MIVKFATTKNMKSFYDTINIYAICFEPERRE